MKLLRKLKHNTNERSQGQLLKERSKDTHDSISVTIPSYLFRKYVLSYLLKEMYYADIYSNKVVK